MRKLRLLLLSAAAPKQACCTSYLDFRVRCTCRMYEPTQALQVPLPEVIKGLTVEDVLPAGSPAKPAPEAAQQFAGTVTALLYVAVGGLDHAHNLVGRNASSSDFIGWLPPGQPATRLKACASFTLLTPL